MKFLSYNKLPKHEKYKRLKSIWPLYFLGIIISYWKLDFLIASIITIVLITLTIKEIKSLKEK